MISLSQGSHLALSLFVLICLCRYASTISHFPKHSFSLTLLYNSPSSIPLLSAFYPIQRLPVLLSPCANSCKLLPLLRKALPHSFCAHHIWGVTLSDWLVLFDYSLRNRLRSRCRTKPRRGVPALNYDLFREVAEMAGQNAANSLLKALGGVGRDLLHRCRTQLATKSWSKNYYRRVRGEPLYCPARRSGHETASGQNSLQIWRDFGRSPDCDHDNQPRCSRCRSAISAIPDCGTQDPATNRPPLRCYGATAPFSRLAELLEFGSHECLYSVFPLVSRRQSKPPSFSRSI